MKLHIFNPEHDLALAANLTNYTPPHAARELRHDLGFLPALWAEDGDLVAVDDVDAAAAAVRPLSRYAHRVEWVTLDALPSHADLSGVEVWGWDKSLRERLLRAGVSEEKLPSDAVLALWREQSNRRWAATHLLPELLQALPEAVGESQYVTQPDTLKSLKVPYVLKSPWSSSGRGVRYVEQLTPQLKGWVSGVISQQGGIMVEPYYPKVIDFAMEFVSSSDGVRFAGFSLFASHNGAYVGNILCSEQEKRQQLARYLSPDLLDRLRDVLAGLLSRLLHGIYRGPLGVDMMVVKGIGCYMLHPCVELNLRRTMGHVALSFGMTDRDAQKLMQITYDGSYHFSVRSTNENLLNTSLVNF